MEVVILSGADADLDEIFARLEGKDAGEKFLRATDLKLEMLRTFPEMAPRSHAGKIRRARIGRTPFGLFYAIEGRRLMVIAVQDLRQDPRTLARIIRSRL